MFIPPDLPPKGLSLKTKVPKSLRILLDLHIVNVYIIHMVTEIQAGYSTGQVAKEIGVTKQTLFRWLAAGELPEPNSLTLGRISYRVWSREDLERAKQYRETHYRQKRA